MCVWLCCGDSIIPRLVAFFNSNFPIIAAFIRACFMPDHALGRGDRRCNYSYSYQDKGGGRFSASFFVPWEALFPGWKWLII